MRNHFAVIIVFFSLFSFQSFSQSLPDWVREMHEQQIDYAKLQMHFQEFWKDKMATNDRFQESFYEKDEFNIDKKYSYLRVYIRQYFELISLRKNRRINNKQEKQIGTNSLLTNSLGDWQFAGPKNSPTDDYHHVSSLVYGIGRINQICFSGSHPNVMYAVGPSGLFLSTDTGNTWRASGTDNYNYQSYMCMAVDPTNDSVIYLGTGDYIFNPSYWQNSGIIKSTDFGQTFTPLFNGMDSTMINGIQINPLHPNEILASGFSGIYKSTNAGASWQHILQRNTTTFSGDWIYDVKYRIGSSDSIWATTQDSLLLSTDGGISWNAAFNDFQFTDVGAEQLIIGLTPANCDYIYIFSAQDFGNIYKSTNGGASFAAIKKYTNPGLTGYSTSLGSYGQGSYDLAFYVDPLDTNTLYTGSIFVHSSSDGGLNWNTNFGGWTQIHPDQHQIIRDPFLPQRLWVANDGGIYCHYDGDSLFTDRNDGLGNTQIYHFDSDNLNDSAFIFGTQDNGGSFTNDGVNFNFFIGGDFYSRIFSAYNNSVAYFSTGGNMDLNIPNTSYSIPLPETDMYEPIAFSPLTTQTVFVGNLNLWESNSLNDTGIVWRKILSDNGTGNNFSEVKASLADSNTVYAIRQDGKLFRSFNALDSVPTFDSLQLPAMNYWGISLTTMPTNSNVLYVCSDEVYRSDDKGQTWTIATGTATSIYDFRAIVADPFVNDGSVYLLGTNKVFYKNDTLPWTDFSNQLPIVTFLTDLKVKKFGSSIHKVEVSSFGRGVWSSPAYQSLMVGLDESVNLDTEVSVYPNPTSDAIRISCGESNSIQRILIMSRDGKLIGQTRNNVNRNLININLSSFVDGLYYLNIQTRNGEVLKPVILCK